MANSNDKQNQNPMSKNTNTGGKSGKHNQSSPQHGSQQGNKDGKGGKQGGCC